MSKPIELIFALRDAAPQVGKEYCSPFGDLMDSAADALEAQAKKIAELRFGNAIMYGTSHPEMYKTELDCAKEEIDRLQHDYHSACKLIADMHYAAAGEIMGTKVGVVEDVAAMKAEREKFKALCDQLGEALEAMVAYSRERMCGLLIADEAIEAWRNSK